jgi:hypothetical protein
VASRAEPGVFKPRLKQRTALFAGLAPTLVLPEPARRSLEDITASTSDASTPLLAGRVSALDDLPFTFRPPWRRACVDLAVL